MKTTRKRLLISFVSIILPATVALAHDPGFATEFNRENCTFTASGSNPYMPLWPGYRLVLRGTELDDEGDPVTITSDITILNQTELIDGVRTRVIEHRELEDGDLIEVTHDFWALCRETGAVWYFGEDVDNYEDGHVTNHDGSWRAGVGGAKPGILMLGEPVNGARYHQELAPGVAEDRAEVVDTNLTRTVPAGTFEHVIKIEDTNPLSAGAADQKYYARGVGLIQDEAVQLIEITPPPCKPDATTLCLSDGRFRVRSRWRAPDGQEGSGNAVEDSEDSGMFWFFGADNIELLVKVLDTCSVAAFNNFWVFAAGMTNVEVTLTATDTKTNAVKEYRNAQGSYFQPVLDTSAFATCP